MNNDTSKESKYQQLVTIYHADLYRYAYWLCGDPHIAEDITQETFLRAWRALDSLHEPKAAKSWLITILRRENARRFERKQLQLVDIDDVPVADEVSDSTDEMLEKDQIRKHILMLATEYREPLMLQVIGGFSGDEIGDMLGLNKNTVMTRLFRARNQLKTLLTAENEERGQSDG